MPAAPVVAAAWRESEAELRRCNAFGFDDLLTFAVRLLREQPARLAWLRQRWRWIVADEFQDTNRAQATLLELLAGADGNVCVCGDDDQAIYGFRRADPRHILEFAQRHPSARADRARTQLPLARRDPRRRRRVREPQPAPRAQDADRDARTRRPRARGGVGATSTRRRTGSPSRWGRRWAPGSRPARSSRVARTGYATEPLQRALAHAGIPHRVLGSLGLYERAEVRDALAYLTLIVNPADAQAFRRAIASPRRGIGPATVTKLIGWAREHHGGDLIAASAHAGGLRGWSARRRRASGWPGSGRGLERVRSELRAGRSLGHTAIATVTLPDGLVAHYQHQRDHGSQLDRRHDAERVLEDLRSLCRAAQAHEEQHRPASLSGFLEHAAGLHAQEVDAAHDRRITVSTIHRAKGAEAQAGGAAGLRGAAAALVAVAGIAGPRAAGRGAAPVLRRRHPRQGPTADHPRRRARPPPHRRPVAVPGRSRAAAGSRRARRLSDHVPRASE